MAAHADLPLDLKYAAWAEPKGMGLCTVAPFWGWRDQSVAWCRVYYIIPHHVKIGRTVWRVFSMQLTQVSPMTHTFAGYDKVVHLSMRLRKGEVTILRILIRLCSWIPAGSDNKWLSKGKTGTQSGMASDASQPQGLWMEQGHQSLAPPHMSMRVAFWEVNMTESQCSSIASPYTHVRVTLSSSLHAVNSQFALPLQWQSTKAKDNLSGM